MNATPLDYQQYKAHAGSVTVSHIVCCAVVALILVSAALGAVAHDALATHKHVPAATVTTPAGQNAGLGNCGTAQPATRIVTLPYRYPTNHCPSQVVLDRSEHLRPVTGTEASAANRVPLL